MKKALIILALSGCFITAFADTLLISDYENRYSLEGTISFFEDDKSMPVDSVLRKDYLFEDLKGSNINSAVLTPQVWTNVVIKNVSNEDKDFILTIENPDINKVSFFEIHGDFIVKELHTGELTAFCERDEYLRDYIYRFPVAKDSTVRILVRLDNTCEVITAYIHLFSPKYFPFYTQHRNIYLAFIFGILTVLVLSSFILFMRIRKRVFLCASLYFLFGGLLIADIYGFLGQYIFYNLPQMSDHCRIILIFLTALCSFNFINEFIGYTHANRSKLQNKIQLWVIIIALVGSVTSVLPLPYRIIALLLYLPYALFVILYSVSIAVSNRKENTIASKTILISAIPLCVSIFLMFFRNYAWVSISEVMIGFHATFTFQMVITAFGLIDFIRTNQTKLMDDLTKKTEHIEQQKFILSQKNAELETLSIASSKTNNSIAIYNKDGNIKWYNEEFINTYSAVIKDVFSIRLRNIVNIIPNKGIKQYFSKCEESRRPISFKTLITQKNKDEKYFQTTLSPITNVKGDITHFVTIDSDITEIEESNKKNDDLQKRLMQMEKLESIGKLAGGIAHDFNNLLTPIVGFADLILLDENLSEQSIEDLNGIKTSAVRAKKLVNQILVFSNYFKPDVRLISVKAIMEEVITLLASSIKDNVTFSYNICEKDLKLKADSTHIHQVIMNITKNALQALSEKGGNVLLSLSYVNQFKLRSPEKTIRGNYACIRVVDSGVGMSQDTIKKVFDPFFTTKKADQGTGLGMSVVHGIVNKYDGYIDICSEEGKGADVAVYFPAFEDKKFESVKQEEKQEHTSIEGNGQHIMIIDDEEAILKMMVRLLGKNGYKTTAYLDGLEAMRDYEKAPENWDMIITDQTMPNIKGGELSRRALLINPEAVIILITGYSEEMNDRTIEKIGIKKLLLKPVSSDVLLKEIHALLHEK